MELKTLIDECHTRRDDARIKLGECLKRKTELKKKIAAAEAKLDQPFSHVQLLETGGMKGHSAVRSQLDEPAAQRGKQMLAKKAGGAAAGAIVSATAPSLCASAEGWWLPARGVPILRDVVGSAAEARLDVRRPVLVLVQIRTQSWLIQVS